MASSDSDNDYYIQGDREERIDEYEISEWQDERCGNLSKILYNELASRLYYICRDLFSGRKACRVLYKHYYYLSSLRTS